MLIFLLNRKCLFPVCAVFPWVQGVNLFYSGKRQGGLNGWFLLEVASMLVRQIRFAWLRRLVTCLAPLVVLSLLLISCPVSMAFPFFIWHREFKKRRWQRHKSLVWLVECGKIIVLHVRHAFWCNFLTSVVCLMTRWNFHIWGSDDNARPQQ